MTKLTLPQKAAIVQALSRPMRYTKLRMCLAELVENTDYSQIGSFESALKREEIIHEFHLRSENGRTITLYASSSDISAYDVALELCPNGYFCNLSSLYYHGLSDQVPKTIYMATENIREYLGRVETGTFTNNDISSYFIKKPKMSRNAFRFNQYSIVLTERVNRKDVGVVNVVEADRVCPKGSRVTSLDRALIDAVVHPQYNGGIASVVEFYRTRANHLHTMIGKMLQIYQSLKFQYPYWQAIGLICDRVGADAAACAIANQFKPKHRFYIDHLAKDSWAFDSKWQIYYPKGLFNEYRGSPQ